MSSERQGDLKFKVKLKEINVLSIVNVLCVTWMVWCFTTSPFVAEITKKTSSHVTCLGRLVFSNFTTKVLKTFNWMFVFPLSIFTLQQQLELVFYLVHFFEV